MRALLQLITVLRRGRTSSRHVSADDYLKVVVILMIALIAGPDIVAAMELTTLVELLGAALFLLGVLLICVRDLTLGALAYAWVVALIQLTR